MKQLIPYLLQKVPSKNERQVLTESQCILLLIHSVNNIFNMFLFQHCQQFVKPPFCWGLWEVLAI